MKIRGRGAAEYLRVQAFLALPKKERVALTKIERKKALDDTVALRKSLVDRDGDRCLACGKRGLLELDHIRPVALGGLTILDNLQLLCHACNEAKGCHVHDYRHNRKRFKD